jgi:hypothetical protein
MRVASDILVKSPQGDGFFTDIFFDVAEILIRRHCDQAQKETVKYAKARKNIADKIIGAGTTADENTQEGTDQKTSDPIEKYEPA